MRRLLLLLCALLVMLTSCEKESVKLSGSKWTFKLGSNNYVMEFTNQTNVRTYQCDANYNFEDSLQEDTYIKTGNEIIFTGKIDVLTGGGLFPIVYHVTSGILDGDVMRLIATNENGSTKEYTLMKLKQ